MKSLVFLLLALSETANAQTSYKCIVNNITSYQAQPCETGREEQVELKVIPPTINSIDQNRQDIVIGNLEIKNGKSPDGTHTHFYPRVSVTNNTNEEKKVFVKYSGIDSDGFAIDNISLNGVVEPHSTRYLSEEKWRETANLKKVIKWQYEKQ